MGGGALSAAPPINENGADDPFETLFAPAKPALDAVIAMWSAMSWLDKLRIEAEECDLISKLATNQTKKELFARLAAHHRAFADEVERAIREAQSKPKQGTFLSSALSESVFGQGRQRREESHAATTPS